MHISFILMRNTSRHNSKTWLELRLTDYLNQRTRYFYSSNKTEEKNARFQGWQIVG